MDEPKAEEEDGNLPRPPAAPNNSIDAALPRPPLRSMGDSGDDYEKTPPHSFMYPPAHEMAGTSITNAATATLALGPAEPHSKMTVSKSPNSHPSQKNRRKGEGGSEKIQKNRVQGIDSSQVEENVSTDDYDDFTAFSEDTSSMMRPGAVSVGDIATRPGISTTPQTAGQLLGDSVLVTERPSTTFEPQIVAFLAPEDDEHQIESRIAQKAGELLRRQMEEGELIMAAEVTDEDSSTYCGLKKRTFLLLGVLSLLTVMGGVVGGMLSSSAGGGSSTTSSSTSTTTSSSTTTVPTTAAPSTAAPVSIDPLLKELLSLNATYDEDLWRFSDPESPQFRALAWAKNDTIITAPGRSTQDLLQRYVLAVLFYATNGPNWSWPYLSSNDVCLWNKGSENYGVYCRFDGNSVDELDLSDNFLLGQLPWELALLTYLEIIDLSSNKLRGSLPTELCRLGALTFLNIDSNQLSGTIPTEIGQLLSLETLYLGSNTFSGTTIPTEFGQLLSLKSLAATFNQLTGTIPTELGQLVSLTSLALFYNELTGPIPTELGRLLSVTYFSIEYNQLTGTIPTELRSLQQLAMGSNHMTGKIPTEFGQLLSLELLTFWGSDLTGTIPSELGQLISLTSLYMNDNQLTGTIPTELGQLTSLVLLYISSNQLTGAIPTEMARMGNLADVTFFENALTGSLDRLWFCVENRTWYRLEADCNEVECSCCSMCW